MSEDLLSVLWANADGVEVCMTTRQMATAAGMAEASVRRALAQLIADGWLANTGQRIGQTAVFEIRAGSNESPANGSSRSPDDATPTTTALKGVVASSSSSAPTPPAPSKPAADAAEVALSDEERADFARRAGELSERFGGRSPLPPMADIGVCADARYGDSLAGHMEPVPRYVYGSALLCQECFRARSRARGRLERPLGLSEELVRIAFGTVRGDEAP